MREYERRHGKNRNVKQRKRHEGGKEDKDAWKEGRWRKKLKRMNGRKMMKGKKKKKDTK